MWSVAQPANSVPTMPAISNAATVQPASEMSRPRLSVRNFGPQSRIPILTTYTKRLAMQNVHTQRFFQTISISNFLRSFLFCTSIFPSDVPGRSGRPASLGSSRKPINTNTEPQRAMMAGIQKHHFHAPMCAA